MNLITCLMRDSVCYRGTTTANPVGILWHDTGAGNPEIRRYVQPDPDDPNRAELLAKIGKNSNGNDWNHPDTDQKGVNAFIGKLADGTIAAVQTLPWNYRPWGVGGGKYGSCNGTTGGKMWIQFEICDDFYKSESYFKKAYAEAVELTAYLCKKYNIDPNGTVTYNGVKVPTILCHQDAYRLGLGSNHGDVLDWFGKFGASMAQVRKDVAAKLVVDQKPAEPAPKYITEAEAIKLIDKRIEAAVGKYIDTFEDLPEWAKPEIRELIEIGALRGTEPSETVEGTKLKGPVNALIRPCIVAFRAIKQLLKEENPS